MKTFLIAVVLALTLAACSLRGTADDELTSGIVERAQQVELLSPAEVDPENGEEDLDDARFATQLEVQLDDGRIVILTYSGPRHFQAGQRVRVHVDDKAAFVV